MKLPLIIINFKSYTEGTGKRAVELAKICGKVSKENDINIIVSPQDADLFRISSWLDIPIFAQSVEPIEPGAHTGHELALAAKEAGASGTLINHSENRLTLNQISESIRVSEENNLTTVVCVPELNFAKEAAKFKPDFIAYEFPELIGTGRPISEVMPESVKKFVEEVSKIDSHIVPLCGAGISEGKDVKAALELGTKGVIVASAVVKSEDPGKVLEDMAKNLK
ncbi:MAG: triose-phosphate isomerase [Candidatus Aenigmarchaeota archaeon]|nr:triose-phosphate isomerase [Candidatus Aenigmarchaeota archaeon]